MKADADIGTFGADQDDGVGCLRPEGIADRMVAGLRPNGGNLSQVDDPDSLLLVPVYPIFPFPALILSINLFENWPF